MLRKTIFASLALALAFFAFAPAEKAEAKTRVHIGVGVGGYGYGYGPYYGYGYRPYYAPGFYFPQPYYGGYYPRGRYYYVPRRHRYGRRISCRRARNIVRQHGFRHVRARDCRGRKYTFIGRKHGKTYRIRMRSRSGRIYSVRRR